MSVLKVSVLMKCVGLWCCWGFGGAFFFLNLYIYFVLLLFVWLFVLNENENEMNLPEKQIGKN